MTREAMHLESVSPWQHEHTFGQDRAKVGELRTAIVVAITAAMMVVEVVAGLAFGSMALLADGLHMASHAVALGIGVIAYVYARRHANDTRFTFGTGKVNALAGFTGAVLLAGFALLMAEESVARFFRPTTIVFEQAIAVAVLGLIVNGACVAILSARHDGSAQHHHDDGHAHDHNLRSAYLHVLADALTSLLAIFALLGGKFFGLMWLDPAMGIVGAVLVAHWSWGLLGSSSRVLLDHEAPAQLRDAIANAIEAHDDNRVADLHVWAIGPNVFAAAISLVTSAPKSVDQYRALLPGDLGVRHITIEVHRCPTAAAPAPVDRATG